VASDDVMFYLQAETSEENPGTVTTEAVRTLAEALWGYLNAPNAAPASRLLHVAPNVA
jgi:hypothetical protein